MMPINDFDHNDDAFGRLLRRIDRIERTMDRIERAIDRIEINTDRQLALMVITAILLLVGWPLGLHPACMVLTTC